MIFTKLDIKSRMTKFIAYYCVFRIWWRADDLMRWQYDTRYIIGSNWS